MVLVWAKMPIPEPTEAPTPVVYAAAPDVPTMDAHEDDWSAWLAVGLDGQDTVTLSDGTEADILTETHAIEVDWIRDRHKHAKWYEAQGQAYLYAALTDREPMAVYLCREPDREQKYVDQAALSHELSGMSFGVIDCRSGGWLVEPQ
jgi:hypothetical protein